MHEFIKNVIQDLNKRKYPLSDYILILPNKRSGLFLKKEIRDNSSRSIFSPIIYEIDEFMSMISGIHKISDTELLFDFYKVYLNNTKKDNLESFDEFIGWGKTLLRDFNEIDRELCNTKSLFNYLEAIKDLNHWSNYEKETELIKKYKTFWKSIKTYHKDLSEILYKKRKGYQGLIYKEAAEKVQNYVESQKNRKHIFIGFNALSKSESEIIQEIIQNNLGEIYWDIDIKHITSEYNNANYFIDSYIKNWTYYKNNKPNIITDEYCNKKNISVIGTPKNIGQIKYVGEIVSKMNPIELSNTAIILSDEKLLIPMINSLDDNIQEVNITMGFPFKYSSVFALFNILLKIHSKKQKSFYYKHVFSILSHELIKPTLNNENDICLLIKKNNLIYISKDELVDLDKNNKELYEMLFVSWTSVEGAIKSCLELIILLKKYYTKKSLKDNINLEFLYSANKIFNQINLFKEKYKSINSIKSFRSMFKEIGEMNTIPFNGEPIKGLQIMGMLETRLLNYENIIIASLNEGILPAGNSLNSFIPFEIKIENKLQTFKDKDAVFAYHFYRIIKRAKNIWLTYNTEPDSLNSGEISRFIRQLEIEKMHKIDSRILVPNTPTIKKDKIVYKKTNTVMRKLNEKIDEGVTASMLCSYVIDQEKFFDNYIIELKNDIVEETIASNTLGNVIHDTLELLYKPLQGLALSMKILDQLEKDISNSVFKTFKTYVNEKNLRKGKNLIIVETAKKYIKRIIDLDKNDIKEGNRVKIISIEEKFRIAIESGKEKIKIKGKIDRVDEYNEKLRVIDYKTGKKLINRDLAINDVGELRTKRGIYNLQLYIYYLGIRENYKEKMIETGIISLKNMRDGLLYSTFNRERTLTYDNTEEIKREIILLVKEILNNNKNFENT